jgi:1-deoxy-D-xylulose-5-phosphate reductoisomerase
MKPRRIAILGSTGSIGLSTERVLVKHPGAFEVHALGAYRNYEILERQYRLFRPPYLCLIDPQAAQTLRERLKNEPVEVLTGQDEMVRLAGLDKVDIVLNAVVGAAGLAVSLEGVKAGKMLALANKESLVAGGPLFPPICERTGARILPIDSEHSAVWQALTAGKQGEIRRIILTASGGPFRSLPLEEFKNITVEQALSHPTWKMGRKVTVDSATMANKGLEVIEAVSLFEMPAERISIVIHPQSIVHSMVEYRDSSTIAQLSRPDMALPITYALFWPDRTESDFGRINWNELSVLTFEEPDYRRFPLIPLAYRVAEAGGTAPAVFNAANEVAVEAFLKGAIGFSEIVDIVQGTVESVENTTDPDLQAILRADKLARESATRKVEQSA